MKLTHKQIENWLADYIVSYEITPEIEEIFSDFTREELETRFLSDDSDYLLSDEEAKEISFVFEAQMKTPEEKRLANWYNNLLIEQSNLIADKLIKQYGWK